MYQLIQDVYPYFVAFFVLESLIWVRRHQVAFVSPWGRRMLRRGPGISGFGLLPTAEVMLVGEVPLLVDADGVRWLPPRGAWTAIPYESLRAVAARGRVILLSAERQTEVECSSAGLARHLAAQLDAVRQVPAAGRVAAIDRLARFANDSDEVRRRRAGLAGAIERLRALALLQALLFLGALPASLYFPEHAWRGAIPWLIPAIVLLHASIIVLSIRLLRRCGLAKRAILDALAPLLLFPPSSAHVLSLILREGYLAFTPVACAAAWLTPAELVPLARRELRRLDRACAQAADGGQAASFRQQRDGWRQTLAAVGIDLDRSLAPLRHDSTAVAYCPLCEAEYRAEARECSDCREPLEPYDAVT